MTIKIKLLLSFLTIIMLTVILGLVSYFTINSLSYGLIPAVKANEKIGARMLALRRNEKDFLARAVKDPEFHEDGTSKYLDEFEKNYKGLKKELEVIKGFSQDKELQKDIRKVDSLVDRYKSSFFEVVEAKRDRGFKDWGRVGNLRNAVHNVEETLHDLGEQETLMLNMLTSRRHEKDYLLRNDVEYHEKFNENIAKFEQLLRLSNLNAREKDSLLELMFNYQEEFAAVVEIDGIIGRTETEGLMGDYRYTINQLEPLVRKTEELFDEQIESKEKEALIIILSALVLIVLLSLVLVVYLSSIISKPLRDMSEAGKKLAGGDLTATMPHVTTKDEIRDIHAAMTSLMGALKYHLNKNR